MKGSGYDITFVVKAWDFSSASPHLCGHPTLPKLIRLFFLLLISSQIKAQYPNYVLLQDPSTFKNQFAIASQKTNSIESDFTQEKNLSMLSEKISSKGKFWFKKENLVRMEYNQPFQYLMILNNGNVYIKDGQKENKISARSNKLFQQINKIMVDCIKGSALNNPDFSSRVFEGKQSFIIELTPVAKNMKDFFKHINITIDKKDYSASAIEMEEISGDNTIIHFTNKILNTTIPDALFTIH